MTLLPFGMNVISVDNFLSSRECDFFINYYKKYYDEKKSYAESYNDTYTLILPWTPFFHFRQLMLRLRCAKKVLELKSTINLNYDQLVLWPPHSSKDMHKDVSYKRPTDWTSVCYLNDDFSGGRTLIEDTAIDPLKGKMVLFNSSNLSHGVEEVYEGYRYTYISWWGE